MFSGVLQTFICNFLNYFPVPGLLKASRPGSRPNVLPGRALRVATFEGQTSTVDENFSKSANQKLCTVINLVLIRKNSETVLVSKDYSIIRKHAKFEQDRTNRTGVIKLLIY